MYLRDMQHPNVPFMNSILNVYLNLWHDYARRCTASASGASVGCPRVIGVNASNPDGDSRRK